MSSFSIDEKIAAITGSSTLPNQVVSVHNEEQQEESAVVKAACLYQGEIAGNYVIFNKIKMSRKEYLSIVRNKTMEDIVENPLMYVLFRSEDQSNVNFIDWLNSFK